MDIIEEDGQMNMSNDVKCVVCRINTYESDVRTQTHELEHLPVEREYVE